MLVTAGMSGLTWTVTRGNNLASPDTCTNVAHSNAATVTHVLTAGGLTNYVLNPVTGAAWANNVQLTLTTNASSYGLQLNGPAGAGTSFGILSKAGTNSSDYSARFQTQAAVDILALRGDGAMVLGVSPSKIIAGATGGVIRNNADSATNLGWNDAGLVTARNAIIVPPSAAGTPPTTSYGTLAVKLDDQGGASNANCTLTVPAGALYRDLWVEFCGRSDNASGQNLVWRFNADSGANYDYNFIFNSNATLTGNPAVAQTSARIGSLSASGSVAGTLGSVSCRIQNADSATLQKVFNWTGGRFDADAVGNSFSESGYGKWRNTANAITSIVIIGATGNLVNWRATLWGLP